MPAAILGPVAGAVVGGVMSDGGGGGGGEVNKTPWDPAIKPLINSLGTGQGLEAYYQQNPFNPLQQAGYQNLIADLDNFRNVMAPQAMAFNNRMMNTNYQRKPAGAELGGAFTPINASQFLPPEQRQPQGGMQGLGSMGSAASMLAGQGGGEMGYNKPMQVTNAGLISGGEPFGMSVLAPNSMSYGLLNWRELNPFTATNGIPKAPPVDPNAKTPEQIAMEEAVQRERDRHTNYGGA